MSNLKDRILASRSKTPAHVLPMWQAWRIANQDHVFSDEALELAIHILKRREKGYRHARHSPSTANHCIRRSVLEYMGYKSAPVVDPVTLGKFDGGNFGHLRWQMLFFDMGILRDAEVVAYYPDWRVAGTCDGIMDIPLEGWNRDMTRAEVRALVESGDVPVWSGTLEIKEMFSRRWANNRSGGQPEPKVRWQGDLYTLCLQRTSPELQGTVFWFENKDTNEIVEYDLPPIKGALERMGDFYGDAIANEDAGTLPDRPFTDSSYECRYCGVSEHCKRLQQKGTTTVKMLKTQTTGNFDNE